MIPVHTLPHSFLRSILILYSLLDLDLRSGPSSPQVFRPQYCMHFSSLTCVLHTYVLIPFQLSVLKIPGEAFELWSSSLRNFFSTFFYVLLCRGHRISGAITSLPQYAFTAWCSVTAQELYLTLASTSLVQIFPSAPCSQTPSTYVLPSLSARDQFSHPHKIRGDGKRDYKKYFVLKHLTHSLC